MLGNMVEAGVKNALFNFTAVVLLGMFGFQGLGTPLCHAPFVTLSKETGPDRMLLGRTTDGNLDVLAA